MKLSSTLFLTFFLTGLSVYYFTGAPGNPEANPELNPLRILTLKEGDSFSFLQIQNLQAHETVTLKRIGPDWKLISPVTYPAENFLVEGMTAALTLSRRVRRLAIRGNRLNGLGFDSPTLKLTLATAREPRRRTLLLGGKSPAGAGIYARWEDEKEYFLMPQEVAASFERTVYSLREKRLFHLAWNKIQWVRLARDGKEFYLEKGKVPVEEFSDLIYALQSLYVKEFLDGVPPTQEELGLNPSKTFLEIGKEGAEEKIWIGVAVKEKDAFYLVREKEKLVLLVSEKNLRSLMQIMETLVPEVQHGPSREIAGNSEKNSKSL